MDDHNAEEDKKGEEARQNAPQQETGDEQSRVPTTDVTFYTTTASHKQPHKLRFPTAELTEEFVKRLYPTTPYSESGSTLSLTDYLDGSAFKDKKVIANVRDRSAAAHFLTLAWHLYPDDHDKNIARGRRGISEKSNTPVKNSLFVYAYFRRNDINDISLSKFDRVVAVVIRSEHLLHQLMLKIRVSPRTAWYDELAQELPITGTNPVLTGIHSLTVERGVLSYGCDVGRVGRVTVSHAELWKVEPNRKIIQATLKKWAGEVVQITRCKDGRYVIIGEAFDPFHNMDVSSDDLDAMGWRHLVFPPELTCPSVSAAAEHPKSTWFTADTSTLRSALVEGLKDVLPDDVARDDVAFKLMRHVGALLHSRVPALPGKRPRGTGSGVLIDKVGKKQRRHET